MWGDSADPGLEPDALTAIDWAYNDTPNAPIAAGAVPEPSSALLVLAGAGTALARRRRKQAA